MAPRKKPTARETELAFEALSIEGGLLSRDWLARVRSLQAGQQADADYRVPKGLNLRDEIGRYWRIAQAHFRDFDAARKSTTEPDAVAERFVRALLTESLGFGSLCAVQPRVFDERSYPIGFAALEGRVPVVIAAAPRDGAHTLDQLAPRFGDGGRRRSAFGLTQEFLNAADDAVFGLCSDGTVLRILRDNASLTRPAWIEADLLRIFTEERYADFATLFLLVHETRFGKQGEPATACVLEAWRNTGRDEGTRAREHLRRGVEGALRALGQGFLEHPDNTALRAALHDGSLTKEAYFQELLRLVYRLIFLLTAEERGLLHPADASEAARQLYAGGYSLRRLRERSLRRSTHDRFGDLWAALKIVLVGLQQGEPRLGLPALAGLFAAHQCRSLDACQLENRALLLAVFRLSWLREQQGLSRVNWRDMGPEELGSVYESLLELVPQIGDDRRSFRFAEGAETKGNARKTTGSYYTPDSLVQVLLDSALEPVITDTLQRHPDAPVDALLGLSIVDPACGSGHFLLSAADRLAAHVARLQAGGTPSPAEYRHALRQVVGRCIFGVDLNPMAVELCKVALWMKAVEPGLPLGFLDSHIQHGNALLGTTPELMKDGIPDKAWEPIEGDDKKVASSLKKKNKTAARVEYDLFAQAPRSDPDAVARAVAQLEAQNDVTVDALRAKESQWAGILDSPAYRHEKLVADAWCAAFVWPKQPGPLADAAPTNELWRQIRDGQGQPAALTVKTVHEVAEQYRFFHWHLQFPQVFATGGFDVVLGNPPWEHVELKEEEWFAERRPDIAAAANAAVRKRRIEQLASEDPQLFHEFGAARRRFDGETQLMRSSGRYPLCARGRINTYAIFAEHNRSVLGERGRAGFIVPTGIATDETTAAYFRSLVDEGRLIALWDFWNSAQAAFFPGVGNRTLKFALVILGSGARVVQMAFFVQHVAELTQEGRRYTLTPEEIGTFNPNTRTCPAFRTRRDADINLMMYRRAGVLWRDRNEEIGNPWGLRFMQGVFNMASDSGLFKTRAQCEALGGHLEGNSFVGGSGEDLPLIEAKMVHHFDHRFGDYADRREGSEDSQLPDVPVERLQKPEYQPLPRYWVACTEVDARLGSAWLRAWLLGWRDITKTQNERTVIASLMPRVAVGHTTALMMPAVDPRKVACLYACLCSFPLDYAARQKVGGTHLTYAYLKQLPVLAPVTYESDAAWHRGMTLQDWLVPRILELTYTAWDLEPFARDVGCNVPPFRWDVLRRFLLRCELDAAFFHIYGLSREDTDYVMETFASYDSKGNLFAGVKGKDVKAYGEYQTKRVILEVYDAIAEASETGKPYQTRLDPLPADPRLAHAPSTRPGWAPPPRPSTRVERGRQIIEQFAAKKAAGRIEQALPFYEEAKIAAGAFDASDPVGSARSLRVRASSKYERRRGVFYFVGRIVGDSMAPEIPDGAYCVFRRPASGKPGSRVLVQRAAAEDPERGSRFVLKDYQAGHAGMPAKLVSLNPKYPPFEATEDDQIVADFVEVVELAE